MAFVFSENTKDDLNTRKHGKSHANSKTMPDAHGYNIISNAPNSSAAASITSAVSSGEMTSGQGMRLRDAADSMPSDAPGAARTNIRARMRAGNGDIINPIPLTVEEARPRPRVGHELPLEVASQMVDSHARRLDDEILRMNGGNPESIACKGIGAGSFLDGLGSGAKDKNSPVAGRGGDIPPPARRGSNDKKYAGIQGLGDMGSASEEFRCQRKLRLQPKSETEGRKGGPTRGPGTNQGGQGAGPVGGSVPAASQHSGGDDAFRYNKIIENKQKTADAHRELVAARQGKVPQLADAALRQRVNRYPDPREFIKEVHSNAAQLYKQPQLCPSQPAPERSLDPVSLVKSQPESPGDQPYGKDTCEVEEENNEIYQKQASGEAPYDEPSAKNAHYSPEDFGEDGLPTSWTDEEKYAYLEYEREQNALKQKI